MLEIESLRLISKFAIFVPEIFKETMVEICQVEQKSLQKILDSWRDMQPIVEKIKSHRG